MSKPLIVVLQFTGLMLIIFGGSTGLVVGLGLVIIGGIGYRKKSN